MSVRSIFLFAALAVAPATAFAHAKVTSPTPRVDAANIKEATAPCGGPRGDVETQLTGGQMLTLEWDETIGHPGFYRLRFSMAGDTNWQMIADNIPDPGGVGSYSYEFQVPDVNCDACTFQWVQIMTDRDPPTNYYSCFDVEITSSAAGTPDVGAGEPDVGVGVPDMGAMTVPDMGTGPGTPMGGNNGVDPGMGDGSEVVTPQADAGTGDPGQNVSATGTCSSAGAAGSAGSGALALLMFGLLALTRGGRRSSRGSSAAR